jgi:DNA polymerase IIIc chi subunit
MIKEINFYQVDEELTKAVAPLMLKILEEKKKCLLLSNSLEIKTLDTSLWSYGKYKFIPHITSEDKDFDFLRQPIFLTQEEKNFNQATYLAVVNQNFSEDFTNQFERIFYFFNQENIQETKNIFLKLKNKTSKINSYKKQDGKWVTNIL